MVEGDAALAVSKTPPGTVTRNGMSNVVWVRHWITYLRRRVDDDNFRQGGRGYDEGSVDDVWEPQIITGASYYFLFIGPFSCTTVLQYSDRHSRVYTRMVLVELAKIRRVALKSNQSHF